MKTVIIDNSLCAYPLRDNADPDLIYHYICALKDAGVKYIELDFRTLMKLRRLPEGVDYIFRMVDPMFLQLSDFFDFKYIVLTYNDLRKRIMTKIPIMFELSYAGGSFERVVGFVRKHAEGKLAAFRIRSAFDYYRPAEISVIYREICSSLMPYPVDVCPLNMNKTALDAALKFTAANADSITLTAGLPTKYCSLEEYCFALMTLFDSLPSEFDIQSLGRVSVYRSRIFQTGEQALPRLLEILDHDIRCLRNADTGEGVTMRVGLKDTEYLSHKFISALEKMADMEDIPDELYEDITGAIRHFDRGIYNDDLLHKKRSGLLN